MYYMFRIVSDIQGPSSSFGMMQLFVCLVLCYSFLIRLSNIQEVRFKEEAVLFQLFESFIQKTKM